ncbi:MAG: hypothetical protein ACKVQT_13030 [Burkholderiales bacterium]
MQEPGEHDLVARVRAAANAVPDPCSLAQGHPIGMTDMGLIRSVKVVAAPGGWHVRIQARVTAPDCLHMVYFERELRAAVTSMPGVAGIEFEWDGGYDWTPEAMAESVRVALKQRRERTLAAGIHRGTQ